MNIKIFVLIFTLAIQGNSLVAAPKPANSPPKKVVIKMATLAPVGSPWHEILKEMAAEWAKASDGQVTLRIYPGGVAGNEKDSIRKIRIGQLHASLISNIGLSLIVPETNALVIPLASDSWESVDRVMEALIPRLEKLMDKQGFVVLNWGNAGWIKFFVPTDNPSVEAVQKTKMFVTSGDDKTIELWKTAGFNAVPLAETDILPALQTGMVNAYSATAVLALASQWFAFTPYMIDLPMGPMVGATIVKKKTWQKIPENLRVKLREIADATGIRLRDEISVLEKEALAAMQERGLKVIKPDEAQLRKWREVIELTYPLMRGPVIPEKWFDDALKAAKGEEAGDD